MDFGAAFKHLKAGKAITRTAWLGKGITLCMTPGMTFKVGEAPLGVFPVGSELRIVPHVAMAVGPTLICWQPSQVDILADDWMAVDAGVPEKAVPNEPEGTEVHRPKTFKRRGLAKTKAA